MHSEELEKALIARALSAPPMECGHIPYERLGVKPAAVGTNAQPLVTIITVTFNAAEVVQKAIQSVADQSYPNIEYLIIDGGSTDDTCAIVRRNASHVDGLICEPDDGIYDAMNKGLARANGQYIALLNADDQLFPEFVTASVAALTASGAQISFCDYTTEESTVRVDMPDEGLFLAQLGIKHNTFLMHRDCFARVGGFDPSLKVVADAKWNRAAFAAGLTFEKVEGVHVFYSLQGLSAGTTAADRTEIVAESADVLLDSFAQLDRDQAITLYLANFNTHRHQVVIDLHRKMTPTMPVLGSAIASAIRWNLLHRPGYRVSAHDPDQVERVLELANYFNVPLSALVASDTTDETETLLQFFGTLERAAALRKDSGARTTVHFARVFSAPSETFIHDFLHDLENSDDGFLHVMLCDTRQNADMRPFDLTLHVPWDSLSGNLGQALYRLVWDRMDMANNGRVVAHFALNGWVLHDRLTPDQRRVHWVNMCHGIDVFAYGDNPNYTAYLDTYCADAPNVAFTVVSGFLGDLLRGHGIPDTKIFHVPNAVADTFGAHRKSDGFWDGSRPLRLLSVGRLIGWKGHDILLRALASIHAARPDLEIELEVVFGRWDEELVDLRALENTLDLPGPVQFTDFVDFRKNPEFLGEHDLFVLPSTLSNDPTPRTETFGVALIEAISAGLPVIGTTAGGIPEVIGTPGDHADLVPHGNADALATAILGFVDAADVRLSDNSAYAKDRLAQFTPEVRLKNWAQVGAWLNQPRKKVLHFCALGRGGAAGASMNVHKGLLHLGYDSWFVTRNCELEHFSPYTPNLIALAPENAVDYNFSEPSRRPEFTTFSVDDHIISDATLRDLLDGADLINLAWSAKFLSVQNIAMMTRLGVPVMMTLRDMQPITGGMHFFHGSEQWRHGEADSPQRPDSVPDGFPALVYKAKETAWNFDAVTFVGLSDHSMDILARSPLSRDVPRIKLPNYVDTNCFYHDPDNAMEVLAALPDTRLRIGYLPSFGSRIKGHRQFLAALRRLHQMRPDLDVTICLASNDTIPPRAVPYDAIKVGALNGCDAMRAFYNGVDVVAVPSLEETFSNTTLEALACGVPVVGFQTGVLQEVLGDGVCGECAPVGDVSALARGFERFADEPANPAEIVSRVTAVYCEAKRMQAYDTAIRDLLAAPPTADTPYSAEALATLLALAQAQQKIKTGEALHRLVDMRNRQRAAEETARHAHAVQQAAQQVPDASVADLKRQVKRLEHRIEEIFQSRSLRLTAPLRNAADALRRLLK